MTCADSNVDGTGRILVAWYQLIVMFLLPVIVMIYCYSFVIGVLWVSRRELDRLTQSSYR